MTRRACCLLFVALLSANVPAPGAEAQRTLLGFTALSSEAEFAREAAFDASIAAADQRVWMQHLTAHPHHLGSPYDAENAVYLRDLFTSFGLEAHIERFDALFPTPVERVLELTSPVSFQASLAEKPLPQDSSSRQTAAALPLYNAYSIDGDVSGELVYVNYGVPQDYDELARRGIDVRGKIVIARYGNSWRGIKPKVAAEHGAVGCIIYSDPRDDGFWQGAAYPDGTQRNRTSGQRGDAADDPTGAGTPESPYVANVPGAPPFPSHQTTTVTKIPVLPISWSDAQPFLRALRGPEAPEDWRGALPFTYHIGPGPARVHLVAKFKWAIVPLYDVVAVARGSQYPDEWVMRGNHHDAWVFGAQDPIAGAVALLSEAKALGALVRAGDRPKRTVMYMLWDGEEPGTLGSNAWAEAHLSDLRRHGAIYINTDTNNRGFLDVEGSHSLERYAEGVAGDVVDPERHVSAKSRALSALRVAAYKGAKPDPDLGDGSEFRIGAAGAGSDYGSFLQHVGVASLNFGYDGEDGWGSYHSIFDSFDEYTRFKDGRNFAYGVLMSQTGGRMVLRFANADVLPFAFTPAAQTYARYVQELKKLLVQQRDDRKTLNALIADGSFTAVADPREAYVPPTPAPDVGTLDWSALDASIKHLQSSAATYDALLAARRAPVNAAQLDQTLLTVEQALLGDGLPRRPWFRHEIYAPGSYTGYDVKTMPGIREAIEYRNYPEAQTNIASVAAAINRYAAKIDAASTKLR